MSDPRITKAIETMETMTEEIRSLRARLQAVEAERDVLRARVQELENAPQEGPDERKHRLAYSLGLTDIPPAQPTEPHLPHCGICKSGPFKSLYDWTQHKCQPTEEKRIGRVCPHGMMPCQQCSTEEKR